ncbi:MAG TPA: iron ABC transporter substrate-binding protein [Acidimicrobiia bacterium]|nr:iron ABC transporter substrate-binding protein [Acidimicrobiia bacterium]
MPRRLFAVWLVVALGLAVVTSCSTSGGGGRLTIYSGRQEELINPLLEDFSDETGIGIDVRYGDSADLALLIAEEGDRSPADVFLSQSPGAVGFLDAGGRLEKLPANVVDPVEPRFRSGDDRWVGISGRVRVLVYNTETVSPADLPQSVFDLTDARFQGDVGIAPTNASFQDFVTAMRELVGDDRTLAWLEGMGANDSPTYANNIAIVEAVGRGEIPFGLVNHYYNEEVLAEDPDAPSANHLFSDGDVGSLVLVTAAAVLDTAGDRRDDAGRLVRFLLSREAQEFYAAETLEYPLVEGVDPVVEGLPPLSEIESPGLDLSSLGGQLTRTKELIEQSGLEQG